MTTANRVEQQTQLVGNHREQRANVIHISSPNLSYLLLALFETGIGIKSAFVDLNYVRTENR
jgi:hypothetical protein